MSYGTTNHSDTIIKCSQRTAYHATYSTSDYACTPFAYGLITD